MTYIDFNTLEEAFQKFKELIERIQTTEQSPKLSDYIMNEGDDNG